MVRLFAGLMLFACLVAPAFAGPDAAAINNAEFKGKAPADDKIHPAIVKAQVLARPRQFLSRRDRRQAGRERREGPEGIFRIQRPRRGQAAPDFRIWGALLATSSDPVVIDYKITEKDVKGPFLKKLPAKMEDMKDLKSLDYTSPREAIAEKFHMSEALARRAQPRQEIRRGRPDHRGGEFLPKGEPSPSRGRVSRSTRWPRRSRSSEIPAN